MALIEMDFVNGGGVQLNPVKINNGNIGARSYAYEDIDITKKYILAVNAKSTDTSSPFNNMYYIDCGELTQLGGYSYPEVTMINNNSRISMYNGASSTYMAYYLTQLDE